MIRVSFRTKETKKDVSEDVNNSKSKEWVNREHMLRTYQEGMIVKKTFFKRSKNRASDQEH